MNRQFYPVADWLSTNDWLALGLQSRSLAERARIKANIKAVSLGVFRQVLNGEWYLSGAVVEAYKWHSEEPSQDKYDIAKLVRTKTITVTVVIED